MTSPLEKISALEAKLAASLSGRAGVVAAITERITKAEAVLTTLNDNPSPGDIDAALEADSIIESAKKLLGRFGQDARAWEDGVRQRWLEAHFDELVDALEKLLVERSNGRAAFRQSKAEQVGELSKRVVLADGAGATEGELSGMSRQLAGIEADLEKREGRLRTATAALRDLKRGREAQMPNSYEPFFKKWERARDGIVGVNFEICEESQDAVTREPLAQTRRAKT